MKINNRLLKILNFLEKKPETNIKEISAHLDISERSVRYEIENLNFLLGLNNLPPIKKGSKGSILVDREVKNEKKKKKKKNQQT